MLKPKWSGLPLRAAGRTQRARDAALRIIDRFGYLQLDTVSIAGARSHAMVLSSRLENFQPRLAEELLQPGQPLFEYWGHEASWIPLDLYPLFGFRRKAFRNHPWWGDLIGQHPKIAADLLRRIRDHGPIRSMDMEGRGSRGWWDLKIVKKVATALWSTGNLAILERRNFQRVYDLSERVIPDHLRKKRISEKTAIKKLLLLALKGHGWAASGTLAQTWRLSNRQKMIRSILNSLVQSGQVRVCNVVLESGRQAPGWILTEDLGWAESLQKLLPRQDKGILLSPFDPLLWDRRRVQQLFGFEQVLEIFKPAPKRIYGYYCLPVLAGERLVARVDLKADRRQGRLNLLSCHYEKPDDRGRPATAHKQAVKTALDRFSESLGLKTTGAGPTL